MLFDFLKSKESLFMTQRGIYIYTILPIYKSFCSLARQSLPGASSSGGAVL